MAISLKQTSGGTSVPLGGMEIFDDREDLIVALDGTEFLKTGSFLTDLNKYTGLPLRFAQSGETFSLVGRSAMTSGGGFYWIITSGNVVRKFNPDGTDTGTQFTLNGESGAVIGIAYIGGVLYCQHSTTNRPIASYNATTGSFITSFNLNVPDDTVGVSTDGTSIFILITSTEMRRYTTGGSLLNTYIISESVEGLSYDGELFLTRNQNNSYIYLNNTGVVTTKEGYLPFSFSQNPTSFTFSSDFQRLLIPIDTNDLEFCDPAIFTGNFPTESIPSGTGLVYYMRVL